MVYFKILYNVAICVFKNRHIPIRFSMQMLNSANLYFKPIK